jgi:tryptophanyl-tRNA synthetase
MHDHQLSPPSSMLSTDPAAEQDSSLEEQLRVAPDRFRVLTGDRPTGSLHLGHYFGTLQNRVRLQNLGVESFVLIADYQVLTDRDVANNLELAVHGLVLDYLAVGIDPLRTTIFTHSAIAALNQLLLPFLSLVSVAELERNPTVKDEITHSKQSSVSGLMFTYPVHQAADILFCKANVVPVGKDQLPHLELTRTIARRFNTRYAPEKRIFAEPAALLSAAPLLLGTDGGKMSKSRNNAVALADDADTTARLIRGAKTDSLRQISYDPEHRPEVSSLVLLAALCQGKDPYEVGDELGSAGSGALKSLVIDAVNEHLAPIRARRIELAKDPGYLRDVLRVGNQRANAVAEQTLEEVRKAMRTYY